MFSESWLVTSSPSINPECRANGNSIPSHGPSNRDLTRIVEVPSVTLLSTVSLGWVWCRRTVIPKKVFSSFDKFQGIA